MCNSFNPEPAATGTDHASPRRRWLRVKRLGPSHLPYRIRPALAVTVPGWPFRFSAADGPALPSGMTKAVGFPRPNALASASQVGEAAEGECFAALRSSSARLPAARPRVAEAHHGVIDVRAPDDLHRDRVGCLRDQFEPADAGLIDRLSLVAEQ